MYKYCIGKKIVKNPIRIVNKITIANSDFKSIFNNYITIDSLESLTNILKENIYTDINFINLNKEDIDYIINLVNEYVEYIDIYNCCYDLISLNKCVKLKEVYLRELNNSSLWDLKNNKDISKLIITNLPNLNDIEGIRDSSLEVLEIKKDYKTIPSVLEIKIKDFNIFKTLKNLKNLSLFILNNENSKDDLKTLSELKNLEKLNLPKNYFTFNEFGWLKSKLDNVSNLDAIYHLAKDPANEKIYYIVIGKDKEDFLYYEDVDYKIFINEYKKLIIKYKEIDIEDLKD